MRHINRIRAWSEKTSIPIPRTDELFDLLVSMYKIPLVPMDEGNDDAGVRSRDFSPRITFGSIRVDTYAKYTGRVVSYYAYRVKPEQLYFAPTGLKGKYSREFNTLMSSNPDLLYSSFLRGSIRRDKLAFRSPKAKYRLELVQIPWI